MQAIFDKIEAGERLNGGEAARLLEEAPLCDLGLLAHRMRMEKTDPGIVTYVKDRNINYTNICISGCRFCAFFKPPGEKGGYVISKEKLGRKIEEAKALGAKQILLQGGLHPDLRLDFYTDMLHFIRTGYGVHVHGFSPPEINHMADVEGISVAEVLSALKAAGLGSIPGGGAEVLADTARQRVSPAKCTAGEWLEVMRRAHLIGLRTTATMMFGHGETTRERVDHLLAVRDLQDETGGFTAFIPWTFQPGHTGLSNLDAAGAYPYMKMVAVSRLVLDNVKNIQVSWVTQGAAVAQAALFFGANDFGSTMIEENVVAAAGVSYRMSVEEIEFLIRNAGFVPRERNQAYELLE